jgi:thiamine-monophosphate kinase
LQQGLGDECELLGVSIVGGDTVQSDKIIVSVTAFGSLDGRSPVLRSGARPGDEVAVAGRLGWAEAGFAVLNRGFRSPRTVVEAHRRPAPPYAEGVRAALAGASSMCDVSDGLLADLAHIATASRVTVDLDRAAIVRTCLEPIGPLQQVGAALGADPLAWVLTGGEDHALVATFPSWVELPEGWAAIGTVLKAGKNPGVLVNGEPADEVARALGAEGVGHVHFR